MVETHSCEMYSVKLPNKAIVKLSKYNLLQECDFQILHKATFNILTLIQKETKWCVYKSSQLKSFFPQDFHLLK